MVNQVKSVLASALIQMHQKADADAKARLEQIMRDLRDKIEASATVRQSE
jgi:hypothetical protein